MNLSNASQETSLVFSFNGQYTKDAIYKKIEQLGLEVVDEEKKNVSTTTSLELPEELPSIEETLMKLSAALAVLEKPGLEPLTLECFLLVLRASIARTLSTKNCLIWAC